MNPLNYPTLLACQKLVEKGIVMKTEMSWYSSVFPDQWLLRSSKWKDGEKLPAPSMAEVLRDLPETEELPPIISRYICEEGITGSSIMTILIDIFRSVDALIELRIWLEERKEEGMPLSV